MKTQVASAIFAASLALGGIPSLALAAPSPADTIDVLNTSTGAAGQYVTNATDGSVSNGVNVLHVSFANRGDVAATAVEFQVSSNGYPVDTVEDAGTFTKDAIINHSFTNVGGLNATVAVIGVKYADGSEWSANGQQPFLSRRQAAVIAPIVPNDVPSDEN